MDEDTVTEIANLFQQHRDELGFVNSAQVREKITHHKRRDGNVVGAAIVNHCVRKPQTTLYDIAVDEDHRREGIASSLIDEIADDSPHDKIIAKCPQELDANGFYHRTGWELHDTEDGKNRFLNVWKYSIGDE